jgi:phosphoribosylaminoimidazolecarboxamide formyltransferase/IMP cyclohydrolase
LSVWDKRGLDAFARGLADLGCDLVASGGTAAYLDELGLDVTHVEEVTAAPEMLGGRVKTLHPRIHAGILARRDRADDAETLVEHEIEPFDVVCVNFYPFTDVAGRADTTEAEAVEMIDVGGPSMLRAAAKNFAHVAPVSSPAHYDEVLAELREHGEVSAETRRRLAAEAFAATARYESAIASWFASGDFPETLLLSFEKVQELRYGENPHQSAAYYADANAERHLLSNVEQLGGKELSFINLYDLNGALLLLREFAQPACVIVKHANACGAAVAPTIEEAYERALASDPLSAFGMVCALNREVRGVLGSRIAEQFADVVYAPGFDDDATAALRARKALRILEDRELRPYDTGERDFKRVVGGVLVQDRDWGTEGRESMELVTGELSDAQWDDLEFAWRVCKHVGSNAIVIARDLATIGIGAGQQSRVDAVKIALDKARQHGHGLAGAVLASDAFFPFADGPELALATGIAAIVQPGGSRRDDEVVDAVRNAGAAMVLTGRRHFRH